MKSITRLLFITGLFLLSLVSNAQTSQPTRPTWSVTPGSYSSSMTVTVKLNAKCVNLNAPYHRIGAFVGNECRGVVTTKTLYQSQYLGFLLVYANISNETVTFKIWDSINGLVYDAKNTMQFSAEGIVGDPDEPYVMYSNRPQSDISLGTNSINENTTGTIGTFTTTDQDNGSNFNYSTVAGTGATDNSLFTISSGVISPIAGLNYENKSSYSVRVRSTDATDNTCTFDKVFSISVNDVAEAPTNITLSSSTIDENLVSGTTIGSFSTVDEDASSSFTYTLANGGADNSFVSVTSAGVLKTTSTYNFEAKPSPAIKIRTTDNTGNTFDKDFIITVIDKNDAPTSLSITNSTIMENKASGSTVGVLSATDPDAGDATNISLYQVSGDNYSSFVIVGNELRTTEVFNYEAKSIYYVNVKATDNAGATFTSQIVVNVLDSNDVPTNIAISNASIGEAAALGSLIGRFTTTDQDASETFTYALVAGAGAEGNAFFDTKGDSLVTKSSYNAETKSSYPIRIRVTDKGSKTYEKQFTVTITEDNLAPTNVSISATQIAETKANGSTIGTLTVTDPDGAGDTHTLALVEGQNHSNSSFVIVGNELRTTEVFDYETKNLYYVYVKATDQIGAFFTKQLIITVKDTNEVPTNLAISSSSFSEDLPSGSFIAKLSSTDQDANSSFTYAKATGSGDGGNASFKVSNDSLFTNSTFRASVQNSYSIRLQTTDNGGLIYSKNFTLTVLVDNDTPSNITISKDSVQENLALGAVVGNFTTVDQDLFDTYQYTFVSEAGNNNDQFQIVNNQLITNATFDFETKKLYYIYVKTTDQLGASFTKQFIVKIFNGNDAPTNIALTNTVFSEKAPIGSFIGKFSSTDQDATDSYAYLLVAGSGAEGNNAFLISHDSIFTNQTFKFSTQSSYTIRVRSTDAGTLNFDKNFTMTVTLQNTTPSDLALTNTTVAENSAIGTVVGTLSTTDADAGDTHSYQLFNEAGNNNDQFIIVDNQLKTNAQFDYETKKLYYVYIKSTDQIGASKVKQFIINITAANDAPTNISLTNNTFSEKVAKGTLVGRLTSTDQDSVDTYTYSLVSGIGADGNAAFLIKGDSIVTNVLFKYSTQSSYSIRLQSKDAGNLTFVKNFTMIVTQDNAAPADISLSKSSIVENAATGSLVGNLSTTDADQEEGHIYTLADESGNNNNMFVISNVNELHTNATFDYETKKIYYVYVKSTDAVGASKTKQFIITVTPGNDAPTNILLSNSVFSEKSPKGSFIGRFSSIDQDSVDTYSYSLIGGMGDAGNKAFRIKGDSILTDTTFNFATQSSYSIRVSSKDAGNLSTEKVFTMTVTLDNSAPTEINLSKTSVAENSAINTLVGTLSTIDPDGAGDSHTYTLSEESGNNNNLFIITANSELRTKELFDYETKKLYFVYIKSADQHGAAKVKQFAITITPANDAPTGIALSNNTFSEKVPVRSFIGKFNSTDQDSTDTYAYSFVAGTGDGGNKKFYISRDSIFTDTIFKFATQSLFSVRVRSTDLGGLSFEKVFNMNVTLDNTPPNDIMLNTKTVAENSAVGALVGSFTTNDIDPGDVHKYELVDEAGNNNAQFVIVNTNELHTTASFDYETKKIYYVYVKSTDQVGASKTKQFIINISDANDAPTNMNLSNNTFSEKSPLKTFIGTFSSTDQDMVDSYSYKLTPGAGESGNSSFTISGDSIFTNKYFKYITQSTYSIRVRVADAGNASFEKNFTMNVTLDNTAPKDIAISSPKVTENLAAGAVVGTFSTTDVDTADTHSYQFAPQTPNSNDLFVIVGNELRTDTTFDYEAKKLYYIYVKSTDNIGASTTKQFIIEITDANDAPTNVALSNNSFSEESPIKTFIGKFSSTDQDAVDTYNYALVAGNGAEGNDAFSISGDSIFTRIKFKASVQNKYSIRLRSTDLAGGSFTKNFQMNVLLDNKIPSDITISSNSVAENKSEGTTVGTFATVDADLDDTHTYSFHEASGSDNGQFTLVEGALKTNKSFDFETKKIYYVYIKTTDNEGASFVKQFAINVTDANDAPTSMAITNNNFGEDKPVHTFIGKFMTTDVDAGDDFNYTFTPGVGDVGNSAFSIGHDSLFTNQLFDRNSQASYSIRVKSTDMGGQFISQNFTILVNEANSNPTNITLSQGMINENNTIGDAIGTFSTADPDANDKFTYTLTSAADNAAFEISPSGVLKAREKFDFETKSSYAISVRSTDDGGLFTEKNFTISIVDKNDAPTETALSNNTVGENMAIGTVVGLLSSTDQDAGDAHTYKLSTNAQTDNAMFFISGKSLMTKEIFDFETRAVYGVEVIATDKSGATFTQQFEINVLDKGDAPTDMVLSTTLFLEDSPVNTMISEFVTTDVDAEDVFLYTFVAGPQTADNAAFRIENNALYTNKTYDINVQENYTIKVKVTDKYGLSFEKLLTLTVKNSNNAPENIAISKNKVEENKEAGTVVGNFSTTDADTGDTHKYTLVTGEGSDDNDKFVIAGNNLVTDETLNFENKSSLRVRVKSTDFAGATFEKSFTISVLDRNDAPTDIITSTTNFNENQAIGSTVLLFGTTDEDNGDQFIYTFDVAQTNDNDKFLIDGNKLLTFANFNYEQKSIYIVRVTSKDLAGVAFTKQLVLKVNDVNDMPTELKLSNNSFPENETSKVFFGKLSTKDEDASDVHSYTLPINPNYENQFFTISGDSIFANVNADYEKKKSYSILVRSTDKGDASIENTFTIAVTDNNDKPSLISLSNNVVSENSEANTIIGLLTATDQDAAESFIFTLGAESGMDNGNFIIDGNKLVMKQVGDFEIKDAYIIAVTATDKGGDKTSKSFLINLTNVNEAPAMTSEIFTIEENTVYGAFVGQLRAVDVDANDNLSYAMVDTAGLPFAINNEGDLVVAGEVDYEKKYEFEIAIRVTDNGGLSSVATVFVKLTDAIEGSTELPINKVLSPNGDGVNDFFAIDNVELYDDYTLTVFTDAGTVVYTVKGGYKNNWDATFNGKHLDSGTYYYLMQSNTDEKQFFKGFFTIIND